MKPISDSQKHKRLRCAIKKSSFAKYDGWHMYASVLHTGGPETNAAVNGNKQKHQEERATKGSGVNVTDKMEIITDVNGDIPTQNLPPEVNDAHEKKNDSAEYDTGSNFNSPI